MPCERTRHFRDATLLSAGSVVKVPLSYVS